MAERKTSIWLLAAALLVLGACTPMHPRLMHLRSANTGPDEFGILPTKPIQMPKSYSALPAPTPGGSNLTDPTPMADAARALGGNPKLLARKTIPAADKRLVGYASRFGVSSGIRQVLAAEDLRFRRKHDGRLLERLFSVNVYFRAYRPMELDQYAELARWRKAGVRTVAAPPQARPK